jgi:hypothetical protein
MSTFLQSRPKCLAVLSGLAHAELGHSPQHAQQLAQQLLYFLAMKRDLLASSVALDVSPSWQLDQLWHAMLLKSSVQQVVAAHLGSDVPHAAADAQLPNGVRLQRRLTAMTLMRLEGYSVQPSLWEEPGTALASVVWVPLLAGSVLPGVYLAASMTGVEGRSLVQHLTQRLGEPDAEAARRGVAGAAAAELRAHAGQPQPQRTTDDASGRDADRPWRCSDAEYRRLQREHPARGLVVLRTLTGQVKSIPCSVHWPVRAFKRAVQEVTGIPADLQRPIFRRKDMADGRTLADHNIGDGGCRYLQLPARCCLPGSGGGHLAKHLLAHGCWCPAMQRAGAAVWLLPLPACLRAPRPPPPASHACCMPQAPCPPALAACHPAGDTVHMTQHLKGC